MPAKPKPERLTPAMGTMTLTGGYGQVDASEAVSVLRYAVNQEVALLDTSDAYPGGEELVAAAVSDRVRRPRIVTKVGLIGPPGRRVPCGNADYLVRACQGSHGRLGGTPLDIVLLHRVDPRVPVEESMAALEALRSAGTIADIGVCTGDGTTLRRAVAVAAVSFVQTPLSVIEPAAADSLLPVARELNIVLLAHSPLHRGLAAGNHAAVYPKEDARAHIREMCDPGRLDRASALVELAHRYDLSAVDVALGWLTSLGPDVVPLPGARTRKQVEQNLRAQQPLPSGVFCVVDALVRGRCPDAYR